MLMLESLCKASAASAWLIWEVAATVMLMREQWMSETCSTLLPSFWQTLTLQTPKQDQLRQHIFFRIVVESCEFLSNVLLLTLLTKFK